MIRLHVHGRDGLRIEKVQFSDCTEARFKVNSLDPTDVRLIEGATGLPEGAQQLVG